MATKAQIARRVYGCSLEELTPGEKARVTREYNAQHDEDAPEAPPRATARATAAEGFIRCEFGRPGYNGVKPVVVPTGTPMEDALGQSGLTLNKQKEGVILRTSVGGKEAGAVILYNEPVIEGATYLIVPGVDSSQ